MAPEENIPFEDELPIEVQQFQQDVGKLYDLLETFRHAAGPEREALASDITDRRIMLETDLEGITIKATADPEILRKAFSAKTSVVLLMADAAERTGYIHDSLSLYSQCYLSFDKEQRLQGRFGSMINRLMLEALDEPAQIEGNPMEDLDETLDIIAKEDELTSLFIRLAYEQCWGERCHLASTPEAIDLVASFLKLYLEERAVPLWLEFFFKGLIDLVHSEDFRSQLAFREAMISLSCQDLEETISLLQDMAIFRAPL